MGSTAIQLVGNLPVATKLAWREWYFRVLAARQAEIPLDRTTVYYVASNGSDSSNGLSTSSPIATLAKVQTLLSANTRFRFRRGDVWEESTGLTISVDSVTLDDWSDSNSIYKAAPRFSRFLLKYNSAGWSVASGNRYTRTENSTVTAIRYQTNHFGTIFIRTTSAAECESTNNSFYWTSNTLHVNLGGTNPNTVNLEAVADNSISGILVNNVDGIRIKNVRVDGFGCSSSAGGYGIKVQNSSLKASIIENCEVFYSGDHCFGHNEGSGGVVGGVCTYFNCRAGLGYNGGSGVGWVSHNGNGDQETIWHCCEASYGALPDTSWYNATTRPRKGTAIFGHTGGSPYKIGLAIVYGLHIYNNSYGCESGARLNNSDSPSASNLENVRIFVNEEMIGNQPCGVLNLGLENHVFMNCKYHVNVMSGISNQIPQDAKCTGWLFNTRLVIEGANVLWNQAANGPHFFRWWGGSVRIIRPVTGVSAMMTISADQRSGTVSAPSFVNSILVMDPIDSITSQIDTRNHTDNLKGNAYIGILRYVSSGDNQGYDADVNAVQLVNPPALGLVPDPSSSLYRSGVALPGGYALEYDENWNSRLITLNPSIGSVVEDRTAIFTTLTVSSSANPARYPQNIILTINATSNVGSPSGTVVVKRGSTTISSSVSVVSGIATYTIESPPEGTYDISVDYAGGSGLTGTWYLSSTSFSLTVLPALSTSTSSGGSCSGGDSGFSYSPALEGCTSV